MEIAEIEKASIEELNCKSETKLIELGIGFDVLSGVQRQITTIQQRVDEITHQKIDARLYFPELATDIKLIDALFSRINSEMQEQFNELSRLQEEVHDAIKNLDNTKIEGGK